MSDSSNSSSGGVGILGLLFIVFLVLKLAEIGTVAAWSWWWVTAPLWGGVVALFAFLICVAIIGFVKVCFFD